MNELVISDGNKVKIPETVTIDNKTYQYSGARLDKCIRKERLFSKDSMMEKWKYKEKLGGE